LRAVDRSAKLCAAGPRGSARVFRIETTSPIREPVSRRRVGRDRWAIKPLGFGISRRWPGTEQAKPKKRNGALISADTKKRVIEDFKRKDLDTGSTEVQVALLTERLTELTEHFKTHDKDHHSRRGLLRVVSRRRRLLKYLAANDYERYQALIKRLGLRR
jgi:small subunit ribosomal protein S15